MIEKLRQLNPEHRITDCDDASFVRYGRKVAAYDFAPLLAWARAHIALPEAIGYEASVAGLEAFAVKEAIEKYFYGEMPVQIGYCAGHNRKMNGMEYHKGSEIVVAATDLMLFLGSVQDVTTEGYDAALARVFFVPAGTAVELYATTLHLAPLETTPDGFLALIILPKGTNTPLSAEARQAHDSHDRALFLKNKWMIAHPESKAAQRGAWVGIRGANPAIRPVIRIDEADQ